MTTTSKPPAAECVGEGTRNLTYVLNPPALRRPDASGEFPIIRPVGIDKLAELSAGETLVLPLDAEPHTPRHAASTVYPQPEEEEQDERPDRYRGTHRATGEPWKSALIGAGALAFGECIGLALMAAFR
jgi:hypothetical protein